jgi:hypothetical protein
MAQGFTPASDFTFDTAGMAEAAATPSQARFSGFGIGFNSGRFEAAGFKGTNTDMSLPFRLRLTDRVSLNGSIPISLVEVEGSKIYGVGLNLGLPIRLRIMNKENPTNWRVTPLLGISARGSKDIAGGGVIWMAGVTNTVDYRVNSKLIVGMVNQISMHESLNVEYSNYNFDPNVSQQILKNGVRAVTPLTKRLIGDAYIIHTNFLQDAAIESYTTFGASLAFRLAQKFDITLGGNYDTGDRYKSWSVGFSSAWKF